MDMRVGVGEVSDIVIEIQHGKETK